MLTGSYFRDRDRAAEEETRAFRRPGRHLNLSLSLSLFLLLFFFSLSAFLSVRLPLESQSSPSRVAFESFAIAGRTQCCQSP